MQRKISIGIVAIVLLAAVGLAWWAWDQSRQALSQAAAAAAAQAEAVAQRDAAQAVQATAVANQGQAAAAAAAVAVEARARATTEAAALEGQATAMQAQATAEEHYQAALAQKLGAQAHLRLDDTPDPTLGGLLAVESLSRYPTLEGDVAARRGIELLAWRNIFTATTQEACVWSVSMSADGRRLATLSSNCRYYDSGLEIKVWDIDAGREITRSLHVRPELPVRSISLGPDGHWLAIHRCGGCDSGPHEIEVVAVDTSQQVIQSASHYLAFSPICDSPAEAKAGQCSQHLALIEDDKTVVIWDLPAGRVTARLTHPQKVIDVAFSPGCDSSPEAPAAQCGRWLAARGEDKVWLWDTATGKLAHEIAHPSVWLRFSPDGRWLATIGRSDNAVRIWEVGTWREVSHVVYDGQAYYYTVEFSPTGQWLAAIDAPGLVKVWETSTSKEVAHISLGSNNSLDTITFSPDGRWLVTGADDAMRMWETGTWRESARIETGSGHLKFSADGKRLATGLHVWELRPEREAAKVFTQRPAPAFSPGDSRLAAIQSSKGEKGSSIRVSDMATGQDMAQLKSGDARLTSFVFSPDGRQIIAGDNVGMLHAWDVATGQEVAQLKSGGARFTSLVFNPEGRIIASDDAGTLHTWDVASGREITHTVLGEAAKTILAFSQDRRWMVSALWQPAKSQMIVTLWDVATGREVASTVSDSLNVVATFSPACDNPTEAKVERCGQWVVLTTEHSIVLWDVNAPHDAIHLADDVMSVVPQAAAFSPDGQLLAVSGGRAKTDKGYEGYTSLVRVWDMATRREIGQFRHPYGVSRIVFSPGPTCGSPAEAQAGRCGRLLVVGSSDIGADWGGVGAIQVWDVDSWREVVAIDSGQADSLSLSPDGRWIAIGWTNGVRVWEASTGREVARIPDRGTYYQPLFSPNGRWLVTVADDHFSVWAWQPADVIAQACARLTRNLTRAEWRLYLGDEPYRATCPALPPAGE
jgi:WD40 repeat protein